MVSVMHLLHHRILLLAFAVLCLLPAACTRQESLVPQAQVQIADQAPVSGFARATAPKAFSFPADHGSHPDFQTEWWYYTGNLTADTGQQFGYQLTFFRRALLPAADRAVRTSAWATEQLYMAHFALTDVADAQFYAFERFARGAAGLAGVTVQPDYRVWLEDWQVRQVSPNTVRLQATQDQLHLDLLLTDQKGVILQGDAGYSRKGSDPGNASYYYSLTHQTTTGTVQVAERRYTVSGLSWMDHEYSTSALAAGQVGWDWFSLHLADGSELMLFEIRRADGSIDAFSSGTYIAADASVTHLLPGDFSLQAQDVWQSPHTDARYPARWQIAIPKLGITLQTEPLLADQELLLSYPYWEGAVRLQGEQVLNGKTTALTGVGYVEMTGYARSMAGEF
jgi:predicted secreted hydrolase